MSGHVGDLSAKQQTALDKLRSALQDIWDELPENDDHFLLRWLRARNFDVKKAELLLRDHVSMRKEWDFDNLLEWKAPEVLDKYFSGRMCGNDREGRPIFFERLGKCDLRGLVRSAKREDIIRFRLRNGVELLKACKDQSEKLGRRVDTITMIYDLEDLSLQRHFYTPGINLTTECVQYFESNFPEILHRVYVVNVPPIFDIVYAIVKPFLNEVTRKKIVKLSGPPEVFTEQLREVVDPPDLPACYGGTLVGPDGDPHCHAMLCACGDIPEQYFISLPVDDNVQHVTVARGSTEHVELNVKVPHSVIKWNFATDSNNIGFGVHFKEDEHAGVRRKAKQMEDVIPTKLVDSHLLAQEGSYVCEKTGVYVVRFSNQHSWVRSKTVHYTVDVEEPSAESTESGTGEAAAVLV